MFVSIGISLFGRIGGFIVAGGLALFGKIILSLLFNHFGTQPSPGAVDQHLKVGYLYGHGQYQVFRWRRLRGLRHDGAGRRCHRQCLSARGRRCRSRSQQAGCPRLYLRIRTCFLSPGRQATPTTAALPAPTTPCTPPHSTCCKSLRGDRRRPVR